MANQQNQTPRQQMLRDLYQSYIKACNDHDFESMEKPASTVAKQFKPLVEAFPDYHWDVRHYNIDGDYLALHFRITGTKRGDFQGVAPTSRKITTQQFTLYHVMADGKTFDAVWDLTDFASIMKQISDA